MAFSMKEKDFVVWWVDRQFTQNQHFPTSCVAEDDNGDPSVTHDHMQAYKSWRKRSNELNHITEWIDNWLDPDDQLALSQALAKRADAETIKTLY